MSHRLKRWIRRGAPALFVALAAACGGKPASEAPRGYGVVVTVSAIAGSGLVLQLNGGDDLPIPGNGTYRFQRGFASGDPWIVTVLHHPTGPSQFCTISDGQGTIAGADAEGTRIVCYSAWKQVAVGNAQSAGVRPDGTLWEWSSGDPVQVGTATDWVAVARGFAHAIARKSDGTIWGWGGNGTGQLGDGTNTRHDSPVQIGSDSTWIDVAAGGFDDDYYIAPGHTLGVKRNGTLWAWGANTKGQLGLGGTVNSNVPLRVGTDTDWMRVWAGKKYSFAQKRDGTLWAWGQNAHGELGLGHTGVTQEPASLGPETAWTAVAAAASHTLGLKTDGSLWAWGDNWDGALGLGTTTVSSSSPVRVGTDSDWRAVTAGAYTDRFDFPSAYHSAAVKADGTLWVWGASLTPARGLGAGDGSPVPVQAGSDRDWATPIYGPRMALVLLRDGTLGKLSAPGAVVDPSQIGTATDWTAFSAGARHALASRADGTLWAWGCGLDAQLGNGATLVRFPARVGTPTDWTRVAAGANHSLAVTQSGGLWAWGAGGDGQLAASVASSAVPISVGVSYADVAAGDRFSVGRQTDGSLWTWGYNADGQLGIGTTTPTSTPQKQEGFQGYLSWRSASAGGSHVLAIESNRALDVWGSTAFGKLGIGTPAAPGVLSRWPLPGSWAAVAAGRDHSLAISAAGSLWAWGSNASGQLGTGAGAPFQSADPVAIGAYAGWTAVAAGADHSLGLRADGTLWAWGSNVNGQLGTGAGSPSQSLDPVQVGTGSDWAAVAAGTGFSLARRGDGTLWGWGLDDWGQTGTGASYVRVP